MIRTWFSQFIDSTRAGANAGFVTGLVVIFLILIGIPLNLSGLALFLLLLPALIFGGRLGRKLHEQGFWHIAKNAIALGVVAGVMVLLLLSLINRWQAKGIDVKQYFDQVTLKTSAMLSGVPEADLHPNPAKNPLTGEYPQELAIATEYDSAATVTCALDAALPGQTGAPLAQTACFVNAAIDRVSIQDKPLRTDPMRLTFDSDYGLHLRLAGADINLIIGGFYGLGLLFIIVSLLGSTVVWWTIYADLGRYRKQLAGTLADNPVMHWLVLVLPLITFVFLWLTTAQGDNDALLDFGEAAREIQLLASFLVILFGLVAVRAAVSSEVRLSYPVQLGINLGVIAVLVVLGIVRIVSDETYFIATSDSPRGSETLTILVVIILAALLGVQNALALRKPGAFEMQFAATSSLVALALTPLFLTQYQNDVMTLVGINILLGLGLNIVVGYAGLLDLGYVAFFALGAYTYAFLSSDQVNTQTGALKFAGNDEMVVKLVAWVVTAAIVSSITMYAGLTLWRRRQMERGALEVDDHTLLKLERRPSMGITLLLTVLAVGTSLIVAAVLDGSALYDELFGGSSPFLIGLIVGLIVSGLAGIMLGIPVLRLRGDYLAIVTLGFGEIIKLLFNNLRDYTGGPQGVHEIPRPLPEGASGPVSYLTLVYLALIGAALTAFLSARLKESRTGRAWSAMRSDEDIAQSMGVNLVQSKLMAFAIGAAFAGVGGVLFAARQRNIFPNDFKLDVSIEVLSLVIIGGMGSIPGVIVGAIALIGVPEMLRELETYRILVFGALLVTMVIIRPKGLLPAPPTQLLGRARNLTGGPPTTGGGLSTRIRPAMAVPASPEHESDDEDTGIDVPDGDEPGTRSRHVSKKEAAGAIGGTVAAGAGVLWLRRYADRLRGLFGGSAGRSKQRRSGKKRAK